MKLVFALFIYAIALAACFLLLISVSGLSSDLAKSRNANWPDITEITETGELQ